VTPVSFRQDVLATDAALVRRLVESAGVFHADEIEVAVELVEERLAKGLKSGYYFLFAEASGTMCGYTAYGPVPCTKSSFDLYWIVVDISQRRSGIGTALIAKTEERIKELGGSRIYVETSSRDSYALTRRFYLKCGYREEAILPDFYGQNDDLVIFVKLLPA
jgi:ribosomal protein S18 acetylase RimI-like enzyme